jgi:heme/copper-type cytochrome/quinol oxidase subunit 2
MLDNGLVIITICGTVAVVLVLIFALFNRRNEQATGDQAAAVQTDGPDDKTLSE